MAAGALGLQGEARVAGEKGFLESLADFSFREIVARKYLKALYGLHLLLGLIVAVAWVVVGFEASLSQGLLALLLAVVGLFFWVLYVRLALEFLIGVLNMAEDMARIARSVGQQ